MTKGTIANRTPFLQVLKSRYTNYQAPEEFNRSIQPESRVYGEISTSSLKDVFIAKATLIHAKVIETSKEDLPNKLMSLCEGLSKEQVMASRDERFAEFRLEEWLEERVTWWDASDGEQNFARAANTKVGITFADVALAESGTVVLLNENGKGRSVSLLPEIHVVLIPASSIVPRLTEGVRKVTEMASIPSCVNFITGPSNSADIESYLVVGVHGPLEVIYLVVD